MILQPQAPSALEQMERKQVQTAGAGCIDALDDDFREVLGSERHSRSLTMK